MATTADVRELVRDMHDGLAEVDRSNDAMPGLRSDYAAARSEAQRPSAGDADTATSRADAVTRTMEAGLAENRLSHAGNQTYRTARDGLEAALRDPDLPPQVREAATAYLQTAQAYAAAGWEVGRAEDGLAAAERTLAEATARQPRDNDAVQAAADGVRTAAAELRTAEGRYEELGEQLDQREAAVEDAVPDDDQGARSESEPADSATRDEGPGTADTQTAPTEGTTPATAAGDGAAPPDAAPDTAQPGSADGDSAAAPAAAESDAAARTQGDGGAAAEAPTDRGDAAQQPSTDAPATPPADGSEPSPQITSPDADQATPADDGSGFADPLDSADSAPPSGDGSEFSPGDAEPVPDDAGGGFADPELDPAPEASGGSTADDQTPEVDTDAMPG